MMKNFVAEMKQEDDFHHLYDHSGFYIENGKGYCVNGLARAYATSIILAENPYIFTESEMLKQIQATTNPSVKGFLVENAVLSFIKSDGFRVEGEKYCAPGKNTKIISFSKGDEAATLKEHSVDSNQWLELLFLPYQWNYPSVDAIYRGHWYSDESYFFIAGIQITLQDPTKGQHAGSRDAFRGKARVWKRSNNENPTLQYVWISPVRSASAQRNAAYGLPPLREIFLRFSDISPKLAFLDQ